MIPLWHCSCHGQKEHRLSGVDVHLGGTVESGTNQQFLFLSLPKFEEGPNWSITLIFLHMWALISSGARPNARHLVLQLDSCWAQNKNR